MHLMLLSIARKGDYEIKIQLFYSLSLFWIHLNFQLRPTEPALILAWAIGEKPSTLDHERQALKIREHVEYLRGSLIILQAFCSAY